MTSREYCDMFFTTSLDGTRRVRISDPATDITATNVDAAASMLVGINPFDSTIGNLTGLKRAERVLINRNVLIPQA